MKLLFSIVLSSFLGIHLFSQENNKEQIEKINLSSPSISIQKQEKQALVQKEVLKINIKASSKNEKMDSRTINKEAVQAKIDYLIELACCEEEILKLQQELSQ